MRIHQLRNRLLGLALLVVVPLLVAGCGGVPGNAVATVDGDTIAKSDYKHFADVLLKSSGQKDAKLPDAPAFKQCIADKRAKLPKPGKGQPKTTDKQLKSQCSTEYKQIRDQSMQIVLREAWLKGEAKDLKVTPTKAELDKAYQAEVKQSFPNKGDLAKYLKTSGQSEADLRELSSLNVYAQKITKKVTDGAGTVSDADIQAYYDKNKSRFAQPARRDLLVVLTKTKAKAKQAKAAIAGGQSFASVAKKFSIDQASKAQGGKLAGVAKGQQEKALDTAVFAAKKNTLTGPVKTQFGFYVFKVTKATAATQQPLSQAKTQIKQLLSSERSQKKLASFSKAFEKKWKAKTECGSAYKIVGCKNGPKATPTPTAATGATTAPTATPTQ